MINYVDENHPNVENICITDGFLPWAVNYHKTLPDFKKRQVTTVLVEMFSKLFNGRISTVFVWVNFSFIFLSGILVYYLARLYSLSHIEALLSTIFFLTAFSILLAYFIPIATYDEPIQYFFILLSFVALKKKIKGLFVLFFTIAMLTRESSVLLLPAITLFLMDINFRKIYEEKIKIILVILTVSLPIILYVFYLLWFYNMNPQQFVETKTVLLDKFMNYKKNFKDLENISRTILSFTSVYLLPVFFIIIFKRKHKLILLDTKLMYAFWISFFLNTVIVLLSVYAEESRVFTLPLLFIFPIFGKIIRIVIRFSPQFLKYMVHPKRLLFLVSITVIGWILFNQVYKLTSFKMTENLYREYNTISFLIIGIVCVSLFYLQSQGLRNNNQKINSK